MTQAAVAQLSRANIFFTRTSSLFLRAGRKGFWPMFDQGIVSLGNFATTIMVARGVTHGLIVKAEYGLFNVVLEFMFFLNTLQAGLITYPLTVRGAKTDNTGLERYATASLLFTLIFAIPVMLIALIAGGVSGKLVTALIAAVALIIWQLQETMRRALWAHFRHADACWGDAVSYIGQAILIGVLSMMHRLSLPMIFIAMAVTSAAAILVQTLQVGLHRFTWHDLRDYAKEFWVTGRWVAFTSLTTIVSSFCGSWALWLGHGANQVADFFAIGNLLKLCNPVIASISGLITPAAAKKRAAEGVKAAQRLSLKYTILGAAMLAPYLLFVLILPGVAMKLFYGRGMPFVNAENALRGCVIGYVCLYFAGVIMAFLNGIEKTRYSFYGQLINNVSQFAILLPMNLAFGLMGYVWGGVVQVVLQVIVLWFLLRKALMQSHATESASKSAPAPVPAPR